MVKSSNESSLEKAPFEQARVIETMTDFNDLIQQLFDADYDTHTRAIIALYDAGKKAVPYLLAVVNNNINPDGQHRVITLLGELQDRRATPKLCELLRQTNTTETKVIILNALNQLDDISCLPTVAQTLHDEDRVVERAVNVLGNYGLPQAIPLLHNLLSHPSASVRRETAIVLGQAYKDPVAVPVLLPDLKSEHLPDQLRALQVLGHLRAEAALPEVIDCFAHPNPTIQAAAATALGQIQSLDVVDVLIERLRFEPAPNVMTAIVTALGEIGEPAATMPLLQLLDEDITVATRRAIAVALGKIGDPMAIDSLRQLIHFDLDFNVQYHAIMSLADIAHPVGIEILRELLKHDNPLLRQAAIRALGLVRDFESIEQIATFLAATDLATVHAAAVALLRMNREYVSEAYERLLTDLFHGDYEVCWFTLHTLESYPDARFTKALAATLDDDDTSTLEMAIGILGEIGDPYVIEKLVPLLKETWAVRRKARLALLKLGYDFEKEWNSHQL